MPSIDVILHLSPAECLAHYEGRAANVRARSVDGRWVVFPAEAIRRVIGPNGIHGVYRLTFSDQGRFTRIEPLARR
ncbi:DUF2835 domain-containing protein [Halomonas aquamarina]|uniref:DUF2835 domain-containing protein n=1 Tax=Vreelandella aquamarina TaxID=77097 RepID=A0ACC5VYJ5_9GAMM|nr:DUF2835 family protein [Halomonas aquamarina]MBZ5488757.1 DUF2835 domain-containing protein [Halomonas aquamarina]